MTRAMKVEINLVTGSVPYYYPKKRDIDKNIEAIDRVICGKPLVCDRNYLIDTKSILEVIRDKLPVE